MPLGPSVVFTRSAMAMAPTKAACAGHNKQREAHRPNGRSDQGTSVRPTILAVSPFSSVAPAPSIADCDCGNPTSTPLLSPDCFAAMKQDVPQCLMTPVLYYYR